MIKINDKWEDFWTDKEEKNFEINIEEKNFNFLI